MDVERHEGRGGESNATTGRRLGPPWGASGPSSAAHPRLSIESFR